MLLQHYVHVKMELRESSGKKAVIWLICNDDLLPFSSLNAHFHFWSFVALLHSDLQASSSPLHVLSISDAHIPTPHFQTFSSSRLFSSTLRMTLTTGQGCQSMLGIPKPLSLSPGSTNLKLKFWSSVELNSFCAFTSCPLSLSPTLWL